MLSVRSDAALLITARLGRSRLLAQQAALEVSGLLCSRTCLCLLARLALLALSHLCIQRLLVHLSGSVGEKQGWK